MSSVERFAYPVTSIEDLAPPVQAALKAGLLPDETVRQMIFAPRQSHLARRRDIWARLGALLSEQRTPDWVLVLTDDRLLLATIVDPERPPQVSATRLADLLWLELGTILLYSWFEWSWDDGGQIGHQKVYFNTVRDDLFWQLADAIRRTIIQQRCESRPTQARDNSVFKDLPFKFKNLIPLRLMLPDEPVQSLVYQPAIWGRRLGVFRHQRAPTTVVVLSPDHLLIAQEDVSSLRFAYGLIARYCPRDRLLDAAVEQEEADLWLRITLAAGEARETLRLLFEPTAQQALESLITGITRNSSAPGQAPSQVSGA